MKLSLYPPLVALALLTAGVELAVSLGAALIVAGAIMLVLWIAYFAMNARAKR
jgi:hypothetical protein